MAKRRGKAKSRRRTNKKINLLAVGESLLIANVVTEGLFNCNAWEFISGRTTITMGNQQFTGYNPSNIDRIITLPELLGIDPNLNQYHPTKSGAQFAQYQKFTSQGAMEIIKDNAKANALPMIGGLIAIPLGFRVATKMTAKPRATVNKMLTYAKVGVKV
jgi:hypothetical protein|tara:strand:+ start:479 stop:958 length:480 start_codon:yes stop_codon:yes gene_type:complete